jgi:hypothetical protein
MRRFAHSTLTLFAQTDFLLFCLRYDLPSCARNPPLQPIVQQVFSNILPLAFVRHAVECGQVEFIWGAGANLVAKGDARVPYLPALRTLDANESDVKSLLEFARS